ncbi:phytanoyl-CoA dioxygenase family protein [Xanthomonas sp. NCPPB 2632]|uniref:phytanoyl-CoA dioxygenase family protein n=1 Tax=Xanthomonas sp. NCPPB 2632 TaxID=3240912 RepID=UPI003518340E
MSITAKQRESYANEGFLFLEGVFSEDEMDLLRSELPGMFARDDERRVLEKDGATVRSVYAPHQMSRAFAELVRDERIVGAAREILGSDLYLHQSKVNAKAGFEGDAWSWHQDYIFWLKEDAIPRPELVTVAVFLHEVTEFNGPLYLVPRSHTHGTVEMKGSEKTPEGYEPGPDWISHLTRDLKYSLDRQTVARFVAESGIVSPTGPAGSVLFFHANLFHASPPNLSPFDRAMALLTYNRTDNTSRDIRHRRPEFLCSTDLTPLEVAGR